MLKKIKNQNLGTPRQLIGTKGIRKLFFDNETSFRLSTKTSILDLLDFLPGVCLKSCLSLRNRYLFIYLFIYLFFNFFGGEDWKKGDRLMFEKYFNSEIRPNWTKLDPKMNLPFFHKICKYCMYWGQKWQKPPL